MKKDKELEFTCDGQYGGLTPVKHEGITEAADLEDSPPALPDLSDLDGVRGVFLGLQQLIRENRRIRWSWDEFEQASAGDTVEMLDQAGFPNWAQCWWDLVLSYERSQGPGFEVRQNLQITRRLWMKETLRRGLGLQSDARETSQGATLTEKPEPTSLDYAREILEMGLTTLRECYTDPTYYAKVAPGVNGALANFMAAEAAELEDSRR